MRNKYSKEFEEKMQQLAKDMTLQELLEIAQKEYNITKKQLRLYLSKRQIRYKDYDKTKINKTPIGLDIGTEYVKPDGMTLIKVAHNKWTYKQRYIYEQYYNVKLSSDDYIIFLDQNRANFDISNLKKITRHECSILSNQKMFSHDKEVTETGILVAKLMIKVTKKIKQREGVSPPLLNKRKK